MRKNHYIIPCFLLVLFTACKKNDNYLTIPDPCSTSCQYLYLGHIYEYPNTVDPRVEQAGLNKYAQIWLGGDVCSETTREESTLDYLDNLFDLGSKNTHWSVGNHDVRNGNTEWITARTGRDLYYTEHKDGLTFLVLNTTLFNSDDCLKIETQTALIRSVCDTIGISSHLIILMHNVVWGKLEGVDDDTGFANANYSWLPFDCPPPATFDLVVYPELVKVQQRGVQVICIAGDLGNAATTYEFTSQENVTFIGSGITAQTVYNEQWPTHGQRDSVLILTHDLSGRQLSWEFVDIDEI